MAASSRALMKLLRSRPKTQVPATLAGRALRTVTASPTRGIKANSDPKSDSRTTFTTGSPTFTGGSQKLLRSELSPQLATPYPSISIDIASPISESDYDEDYDSDFDYVLETDADQSSKQRTSSKTIKEKNGVDGEEGYMYDVTEDEEAKYGRFDMPGIGKEDLKMWVEKGTGTVVIEGEAPADSGPARRYSGSIELDEGRFVVTQIKAEVKNGILKVVIPKVKFEDRKDVLPIQIN